jgi:hypothetical protein
MQLEIKMPLFKINITFVDMICGFHGDDAI